MKISHDFYQSVICETLQGTCLYKQELSRSATEQVEKVYQEYISLLLRPMHSASKVTYPVGSQTIWSVGCPLNLNDLPYTCRLEECLSPVFGAEDRYFQEDEANNEDSDCSDGEEETLRYFYSTEEDPPFQAKELPDPSEEFVSEIKNLVIDKVKQHDQIESFVIDINRLIFEKAGTIHSCINGLVQGLVRSVQEKPSVHFTNWSALLKRYVTQFEHMTSLLSYLETELSTTPFKKHFHVLVKVFYEEDIIDEDTILDWKSEDAELTGLMKPFIDWLQSEEDN